MQADMVHFSLNYTFWLNLAFAVLALALFVLARRQPKSAAHCEHHAHHGQGHER
jgi:preprotein translocase subunit SecG